MIEEDDYSATAARQLDEIEVRDPALYDDLLKACEFVFDKPSQARGLSSAVTTQDHLIVYRLPVVGRAPYCVFWTAQGPRVEAVFPYSR